MAIGFYWLLVDRGLCADDIVVYGLFISNYLFGLIYRFVSLLLTNCSSLLSFYSLSSLISNPVISLTFPYSLLLLPPFSGSGISYSLYTVSIYSLTISGWILWILLSKYIFLFFRICDILGRYELSSTFLLNFDSMNCLVYCYWH